MVGAQPPLEESTGLLRRELLEKKIKDSYNTFEQILGCAKQALREKRLLEAVVWAEIAADYAWHAHPGFYFSFELERLLMDIAQDLDTSAGRGSVWAKVPSTPGDRSHMLHVMTQAYAVGGHTRVVERWIRNTRDRWVHSVIATGQEVITPDWLRAAVAASGGWYRNLGRGFLNHLARALTLKTIASKWADVVVLHTHPYDPIPPLAFGTDGGPPIIHFNHADHVFWIGSTIADVVADIRPAGKALSLKRRGIYKSSILPIPLLVPPTIERDVARKALGIGDDVIVLLSVGSAYKYTSFGAYDFVSFLVRLVGKYKNLVALVVGPSDSGRWAEARVQTAGRIRALGVQTNLATFHAACDIYLDSFPFGSLTATLEAGVREKAVVGLKVPQTPIFSSDDISLNRIATHVPTVDELESSIEQLALCGEARLLRAHHVAESIKRDHLMSGWERYLEALISALPGEHSVSAVQHASVPEAGSDDLFLAGFQDATDPSWGWAKAVSLHSPYFPALTRIRLLRWGLKSQEGCHRLPLRAYVGPTALRIARAAKQRFWR